MNEKFIDVIFPKAIGNEGIIAAHAFTNATGTPYIGNSSTLTLKGYIDPYGFDNVRFYTNYSQDYFNTDVGNSYLRSHPYGTHLKIYFPNDYVNSFIFKGSLASDSAEIVLANDSANKYIASFALEGAPFSTMSIDVNTRSGDVYFYSFCLKDSHTRNIAANGYSRFYAGMAIGSDFCASEYYSRQMTDPGLGFYGRRDNDKDDGKYYYDKNGCGGYGDECNKDGYMYAMALYNEWEYVRWTGNSKCSVTHDDNDGNYRKDNLMLKWYGNNKYNSYDVGDQKDNDVSEMYNIAFSARNVKKTYDYYHSMRKDKGTNYTQDISIYCSSSNSDTYTGYN